MKDFFEFLQEKDPKIYEEAKRKKWLQDVKNTGECTPMSKPTCTGKKLAFAKRVHGKGDIRKANLKKGKNKKGKD
jgi:hypothetical protein